MEENNVPAKRRTNSTVTLNIASGIPYLPHAAAPEVHFSPGVIALQNPA